MRSINLPSPGLAVAFVALLVALSGTAIALPGRGSVDSGDIRNGAVKSADIGQSQVRSRDIRNSGVFTQDIRNSTIRSRDIAANTVTGDDINESTLGPVPNAVNATNATNATNAGQLGGQPATAFAGANETVPFSARVSGDGEKTLATAGPFRLFLRCDADESGEDELAELVMTTSTVAAAFDDNNGPEYVPWDPASDGEAVLSDFSSDVDDFEAELGTATANAVENGGAGMIVHSYALGTNLGGTDDTCFAQGVAEAAPAS